MKLKPSKIRSFLRSAASAFTIGLVFALVVPSAHLIAEEHHWCAEHSVVEHGSHEHGHDHSHQSEVVALHSPDEEETTCALWAVLASKRYSLIPGSFSSDQPVWQVRLDDAFFPAAFWFPVKEQPTWALAPKNSPPSFRALA